MQITTKPKCRVVYSEKLQKLGVTFEFSERALEQFRRAVPAAKFHKKSRVWSFAPSSRAVLALSESFDMEVDPAATALVESARAKGELYDRARLVKRLQLDMPDDYQFKMKPYSHQLASFNWARNLPEAGLFMQCGTGKSKVACDLMQDKFNRGLIRSALIICPKSILYKWEKEIIANTNLTPVVVDGGRLAREKLLCRPVKVHIINYEGVLYTNDFFNDAEFDMIVADESHRMKNGSAKTSKAIYNIKSKYRLALTGTPVAGSMIDLWGQFFFLDKGESLYETFWAYKNDFFVNVARGGQMWEILVPNIARTIELERLVNMKSIRYTKEECLDLPPVVEEFRDVEMSPNQAKAYMDITEDSITKIGDKLSVSQARIVDFTRFQQITSGFLKMEDGSEVDIPGENPKLAEIVDMLGGELRGMKVIIWAKFTHDIDLIYKAVEGLGAVKVDGRVTGKARFDALEKFQNDPECNVIVCHVEAMAEGVDITAACVAIFYSYSWRYDKFIQAMGRNHRSGTNDYGHKSITYIFLRCKRSIDCAILKAMEKKQDFSDQITGDNLRRMIEGAE